MIAKVRIAPVERWCPAAKAILEKVEIPGTESSDVEIISIETSSMRESRINCGGSEWLVVALPPRIVGVNPVTGTEVNPPDGEGWICQHMLEMD